MTKKKVRRVRKARPQKPKARRTQAETGDETAVSPVTAVAPKPRPSRKQKKQAAAQTFEQEYAYVLKDLRLVFILAIIMFVLLIVLNLVL
ncbi:MAG: hypothetical protein KAG66_09580 [Methylococcales bacterium]|nr:hypothetical protein [Methylococcales bacterium]